jgi:hypothetical protein
MVKREVIQVNDLISKSEYAKHRNCSPSAVTRAIQEGRIIPTVVNGRELIDPALADSQWLQNTRPRLDSGNAASQGEAATEEAASDEPLYEARRRLTISQANQSETQEALTAGSLVAKVDVERGAYEAARALRDGMTNCSRRISAEVASLSTPDECEVVISREHRHLLDTFSKQLAANMSPRP